jgi:outer membrane protein assembly factor BamE (lipoprotein component of BamABCDE complex)|tara:strand:- start:77 stop:430 length:354 start_codon:yes stop_codon:yes gene_type:complete
MDDLLISSDKIAEFEVNITSRNEIFKVMGSPSIEINDVNNVWIYLLSLKEQKVFEEDSLLVQNIFRYSFNKDGILENQSILTVDDFNKISFSSDVTKVRRDAYGITDQLYEAFTRGN